MHTPIKPPQWAMVIIDEYMKYDPVEGLVWSKQFRTRSPGTPVGKPHSKRYINIILYEPSKKIKNVLAHHIVWYKCKGEWPLQEIDHLNKNRADNRIDNLEVKNHSDNCSNGSIHRDNLLGEKWISYVKNRDWYRVRRNKNGKEIVSANFKTLEEAVAFRDAIVGRVS